MSWCHKRPSGEPGLSVLLSDSVYPHPHGVRGCLGKSQDFTIKGAREDQSPAVSGQIKCRAVMRPPFPHIKTLSAEASWETRDAPPPSKSNGKPLFPGGSMYDKIETWTFILTWR